jgi:thymidylate kinase
MEIERTLINLFHALEEEKITYSLLRGFEELGEDAPEKEVDLLVKNPDLGAFAKTAAKLGFVELPRWGYEPHYFYVAYDREANTWLKLDVVTDLAYGKPIRWLKVDLAEHCLLQRCKVDPTYTLSPADEFVTLFFHCLLDKGHFREERRERLQALLREAEAKPQIKTAILEKFDKYLPPAVNDQTISELISTDDRRALSKYRTAFSRKLFRSDPAGNIYRKLGTVIKRRLRIFYFILKQRGLWIALLAPDGAGKTTLAHTLVGEQFLRARLIYMGTNLDSSTVGFPTSKWLKKQIKRLENRKGIQRKILLKPLKMIAYVNRLLEQWYRVGAGIYFKLSGRVVVFDRFVYDSHLAASAKSTGQKIRRWLIYGTCPPADATYLLDAPGEVLFKRKGEHSPVILEKQRQTFLSLQSKIPNMVIVDATQSADQVRGEILSNIWKMYGTRLNGNGRYEGKN